MHFFGSKGQTDRRTTDRQTDRHTHTYTRQNLYILTLRAVITYEGTNGELRTSVSGAASYFDKRFLQMQVLRIEDPL